MTTNRSTPETDDERISQVNLHIACRTVHVMFGRSDDGEKIRYINFAGRRPWTQGKPVFHFSTNFNAGAMKWELLRVFLNSGCFTDETGCDLLQIFTKYKYIPRHLCVLRFLNKFRNSVALFHVYFYKNSRARSNATQASERFVRVATGKWHFSKKWCLW